MRFQKHFSPTVIFETNNKQHDHVSKFYAVVVPPNLGKKGDLKAINFAYAFFVVGYNYSDISEVLSITSH